MLKRTLTLAVGFSVLLTPLAASAITFNVLFSAGTINPTGTITFASVNDTAPSSFSFTRSTRTWTEADSSTGCWNTTWSGGTPTGFGSPTCWIGAGFGTNETLGLDGTVWDVDFGGTDIGTLAFSAVPEPSAPFFLAGGLLGLAARRRRGKA